MTDARVREADDCVKRADKALRTSFLGLKFKPDYDSAAADFERAAVCLKNAKKLAECRDAYLKAADCHDHNKTIFHAAKNREQAALVCKELGEADRARELMELASEQYAESGSPDTSAAALEKVARFFEPTDPDKALQVYKKALALVQDTDRSRQASEFMNRITKLLLKLERYEEASASVESHVDLYAETGDAAPMVGRLGVALVLIQLARADSVQADKSLQRALRVAGVAGSDDAAMATRLISVYESADAAAFAQLLQHPNLKSMDDHYLRLMRKIKLAEPTSAAGDGDDQSDDEDLK